MKATASSILAYLQALLDERGLSYIELAEAIQVPAKNVTGWFEYTRKPSIQAVEAMCCTLRVTLLPLPADQYDEAGQLFSMLSNLDARRYAAVDVNPSSSLSENLRDLKMQRLRLEEEYSVGAVTSGEYHERVCRLSENIRRAIEAMTRRDAAAALGGTSYDDVEFVEGSPEGLNYDKEKVARVKEKYRLLEEAETQKEATKEE